jgi:hypothetical protein
MCEERQGFIEALLGRQSDILDGFIRGFKNGAVAHRSDP